MRPLQGLIAIMFIILLLLSPVSVFAEESVQPAGEQQTMQPAEQLPDMPNSESAILIDAKSGAVLFAKNESERLYPASITKIVTGIIALEQSDPSDMVTVSKNARGEDGTRIYLAEGEQKPMLDLIEGMLINSGNDAATAIAEHIDGTKEQFAVRMNEFVRKLGTWDTNFVNPSGLPDENQYTTARDMAKIAQYAMQNDQFRQVVSTQSKPWVGEEWVSKLENHNKLLSSYEGAIGVKNGFTQAAGYTLVSAAERGDMELIGVVLKGATDAGVYKDMTQLLDYGFAHFTSSLYMEADEKRSFVSRDTGKSMEFTADRPFWVTIKDGVVPDVAVDSNGRAFVQGSEIYNPSETAAALVPIVPLAEQAEVQIASVTKSNPLHETSKSSGWSVGVTIAWSVMLLFMLLSARIIYVRQRRRKFYK
ncbi:D-alanyl-D-alanine carboxypeptidase (penicillin-binding protein 5/6) [Paenibacillus catalpae]|uniref:D-alanyl-D-alanine carboxypeptidase (Penicillin-binding protein 5/6) n=1 Tax=Paenibacillus catalpae TaxID=1045775 RepID=A0A1I1UT35_9BACL|nr:D-alanyl-D-alanine carboxypeptidase family protein [Paenibacillus catalpae]SFD71983.1 D-alanyl-D-alanine carboxypeptidase (penicillin-binding protein 5/6) [Paenibacillus catalpae]